MSDLHIEQCVGVPDASTYITPGADVLVLAGDIGRIHRKLQLRTFLIDLCSKFKFVLYVLGNHEYYKVSGIPIKGMDELFFDLLEIRKDIPNLHILNRSSVVIGDVCIAGCTLWSQATVEIPKFIVKIKDMNLQRYNSLFSRDLAYVNHMIAYCQKKKLKLVIVTHHCPTHSVSDRSHYYKTLYTSNLEYLLEGDKIHTWVCGHVHKNFDFLSLGGTRIVSNQKGKPWDVVKNFSKTKVIRV